MMNFIIKAKDNKYVYLSVGSIVIVLAWILTSNFVNNEIILPKLPAIFQALFAIFTKQSNLIIIVNTITRLLLSAGIAFLIGMILLILMILKNEIIYLFKPLITILKTVPVASIIIVLLIWFGSGKSPLIITTLVILPIMIESFATGYKNIDRSTIEELKMVGSNNLYAIFKVYIPMIRPFIFMGLIQSMGLGIKVMVMAELISQTRYSIGNQIYLQKINLNMASLFAWTFVLVIIVVIIELFINHIKKKMLV